MELVDGPTLAARIASGAIPLAEALKIFGTLDHESDRAPVGSNGQAVYPGRKSVSGEQRRQAWAVAM